MAVGADWKLVNPDGALQKISTHPLDARDIDHKPVGLELQPNLSFPFDGGGRATLTVGGSVTVAILRDPSDPDEDGILNSGAEVPTDARLTPQLRFGPGVAYLKYRAEAAVTASAGVPLTSVLGIDAGAEARVVFCDYRTHKRSEQARNALLLDLAAGARFATHVGHVEQLKPGEGLALRFGGALHTTITMECADLFTGQIGTLGRLLGATTPLAFSFSAGARITGTVRFTDDFLVVFSRGDEDQWRVGVRKSRSSAFSPTLNAGIEVGFANPEEVGRLAATVLEGLLGVPVARLEAVLEAMSIDAAPAADRKLLAAALERVGLDVDASLDAVRSALSAAEARVRTAVEQVARARIAIGFGYEYSRIATDTNLLQASLSRDALRTFHADVVRGHLEPLTRAVASNTPGVALEVHLNQREVVRTRSWGFTLGFGKWAQVGGKDLQKLATVRRVHADGRVQESYLAARSYAGDWVGERFEWNVDLLAEMRDFVAAPRVADYTFGIHLTWLATQDAISARELEEWLDGASIWRVLSERDLVDVRGRLAGALDQKGTCALHITIPHAALLTMLPALSGASVGSFAQALAAAMPWLPVSPARSSASRRRHVYAPLWAAYLADASPSPTSFAQAAVDHVRREGHPELATREMMRASGADIASFARLTQVNGDTRGACAAFTSGIRTLHTAIASGARNTGTIEEAVGEMNDLWVQSHHVRAIGVYLLDAAHRTGVLDDVTRTLTVEAAGLQRSFVVTA